ncbi:unnamed protein product [Macrosiphum euphorbiae]|uniref:Uncharacterized protein n=1 Tax=Macrosiphum euphorbiae TaxID=13131 RepID=A0AAV0WRF9_9HEMI|nr:unnamed protein product [Macrosiphum euphorbiae]
MFVYEPKPESVSYDGVKRPRGGRLCYGNDDVMLSPRPNNVGESRVRRFVSVPVVGRPKRARAYEMARLRRCRVEYRSFSRALVPPGGSGLWIQSRADLERYVRVLCTLRVVTKESGPGPARLDIRGEAAT